MANSNGDDSIFKMLKKLFSEKLLTKEIFITEDIKMFPNEHRNSFSRMNEENKELSRKSLEIISLYNKDFDQLKYEYLLGDPVVNLPDFKDFLTTKYSGFYYKKAIFLFMIRCLFIIAQFLFLYLLSYPEYKCVHKSIDNKKE